MLAKRFQRRAGGKPIAAQVVRDLGQERLPAVRYRQQARDMIERSAEVVVVAKLRRTCVQGHSYADRKRLGPGLGMQRLLCGQPRQYCLRRGGKRDAKGIADGLEDMTATRGNGLPHQFVVARDRRLHRRMTCLPQSRAAFNVSKQEGNGAGRQ